MNAKPYRIVVGVDFSDTSLRALEEGFAQTAARPGVELHAAAVIDNEHAEFLPPAERHLSLTQIADQTRDRLQRAVADMSTACDVAFGPSLEQRTFAHVRVGPIAEQLAALAAEISADLVIVGTHGRRGLRRLMLGSVAEKTVRLAPCPVLVMRPRDTHAMDAVPALEPACEKCVAMRERTLGAAWWCEAHTAEPDGVHIYSRSGRLDQPLSSAPFGSMRNRG